MADLKILLLLLLLLLLLSSSESEDDEEEEDCERSLRDIKFLFVLVTSSPLLSDWQY